MLSAQPHRNPRPVSRTRRICPVAIIAASAGFWLSYCSSGSAAIQTFVNDFAGFQAAAGPLSVIDFETLPDGSPSVAGTAITASFNYDMQGAHFTAPAGGPNVSGNTTNGFNLTSLVPFPQRSWIDAELSVPAGAVGIFFPGGTRLFVYDASDQLIAWASYNSSGSGFFLGIVSAVPIRSARIDRGTNGELIQSFYFAPIPEPGAGLFLVLSGAVIYRRSMARRRS